MPDNVSYTISVTERGRITVDDGFQTREHPTLDQALDSIQTKILAHFRARHDDALRAATKVGVDFPDEQDSPR